GATALIAILVKHKYIPWIIFVTLLGYFFLLLFGHGFEQSEQSIISIVDRAVLGINHMYQDAGLPIDPEGLLSTLPSICHVLIGFLCGEALMSTKDNDKRIQSLFIVGTILTLSGFLLSYGCPINKKIWSPTFVMTTCGLASSFLAILIWIIDIKGYKAWSRFFESFGVNPLFMYVMGAVLSILLGNIRFDYMGEAIALKSYLYSVLFQPYLGDYFGSFAFAILFVCFNWIIGYVLYKKKIYIKI
ncbi:MAG: DUF5009 domain-containing protein, partial [Bacteroidaceae bacterium]